MAKLPSTFEGKWPTVLLANIQVANFIITVDSTIGLHTKQKVALHKAGEVSTELEIKRVLSDTQIHVGRFDRSINEYENPVEFDGGSLEMQEQNRNRFDGYIVLRAVYQEEPAVALRTMAVDQHGQIIDSVTDVNGVVRQAVDANVNVSIGDVHVDISSPKSPTIVNIPIPAAATEQSYTFPNATKRFLLKMRKGIGELKYAFISGDSGTVFATVPYGAIREFGDLDLPNGFTLYFQCSRANTVLEVVSWQL
jgi:hypothetical protein